MTTFAAQAGIGIELADRVRDVQRLALLADRDRIARDLHEQVIQRLFATGISLLGHGPLTPDGEASRRVNTSIDSFEETSRDIPSAIFELEAHDRRDSLDVHAGRTGNRRAALEQAARWEFATLRMLTGRDAATVLGVAAGASAALADDVEHRIELQRWIAEEPRKDGIPVDALPAST